MRNVGVKGSVVFITGANRARGIGRALVEEAVKRGAKKVYATSRNPAQLDSQVHFGPLPREAPSHRAKDQEVKRRHTIPVQPTQDASRAKDSPL